MKTVEKEIGAILSGTISSITQRSIFNRLGGLATTPIQQLTASDRTTIMQELENSVRLFARSNSAQLIAACAKALNPGSGSSSGTGMASPAPAMLAPKKLPIEQEKDIATARLEAWSEAVRIGLSKFASVKVATAVSELARNIVFYAGKGTVELRSLKDERGVAGLQIIASDQGPGIPPAKLEEIWAGTYKSQRGMGKGLVAVKKLVDDFQLDTRPGVGTTVTCVFRGER
ncbi:MAG TPA: ATP-binding protein [Thermoanaerobaculia bacterium]|jgi:serine/threonine-protein kinase RsbT|nr:ATP-binding protein [Thermoanaerobaculia bacterium]